MLHLYFFFFFFNDTATTEIYTLSLHDALPIFLQLQPRLRQQYQVICIKQFPWQAFLEIVSYGLHYYVEQDWAKYRPLVYPHLKTQNLKTFTNKNKNKNKNSKTSKLSLSSPFLLTAVVTPSYILL